MDVEICKTRVMRTCPNCRNMYLDELHTSCPACYDKKLNRSKQMGVSSKIHLSSGCTTGPSCTVSLYDLSPSKQKQQQRLRRFLSGGTVTYCGENSGNKTGEKSAGNSPCKKQGNNASISPTASLSFILPSTSFLSARNTIDLAGKKLSGSFFYSDDDLQGIFRSQKLLNMSGWYHHRLSWKGAIDLLMPTTVGTFLVRDSSDSNHLYSLSVQTKCGPTSIRIHYSNGEFRLDADNTVAQYLPKFSCLIQLIESYIDSTRRAPLKCSFENETPKWIDCMGGRIYSQIVLTKPVYSKDHFPSLKHLSRLCVNRYLKEPCFRSVVSTRSEVVSYLEEYPYKY